MNPGYALTDPRIKSQNTCSFRYRPEGPRAALRICRNEKYAFFKSAVTFSPGKPELSQQPQTLVAFNHCSHTAKLFHKTSKQSFWYLLKKFKPSGQKFETSKRDDDIYKVWRSF